MYAGMSINVSLPLSPSQTKAESLSLLVVYFNRCRPPHWDNVETLIYITYPELLQE